MGCCDLSHGHTTISVEEEKRRERRRRQRQKCFDLFKKFIAFLFSHIGLCALVVGYSIMGGFLFRALEADNEMKENMLIADFKEKKIQEIYDVVRELDTRPTYNTHSNFSRKVRVILVAFQEEVTRAVKEKGWDGKDRSPNDLKDLQWSFAGALLYAVTVITTIGYGHVAPKTIGGRLVTILYALIGIPLTFLYLSNIGTFLAEGFRLVYKKVCCDLCCCQKCERKRKRQRERIRRLRHLQAEAKNGHLIRSMSVKKTPQANIVMANECVQNPANNEITEAPPFSDKSNDVHNERETSLGPAPAYDEHVPLQIESLNNESEANEQNHEPDKVDAANDDPVENDEEHIDKNESDTKKKKESVKIKKKESSKRKKRWTLRSKKNKDKKRLEQSKSVPSDMEKLAEPEDAKRSLSTQNLLSGQESPGYESMPNSPTSSVFPLTTMIPKGESQTSVDSYEFYDAESHLGSVRDMSGLKNIDNVQETDILGSHDDLYDGAILQLSDLPTVKETAILDDNVEDDHVDIDIKETAILDSDTESECGNDNNKTNSKAIKSNRTNEWKAHQVVPNVATVLPILSSNNPPADGVTISSLSSPNEPPVPYLDIGDAEAAMDLEISEYNNVPPPPPPPPQDTGTITVIQHDLDSDDDMSEHEKVTVPISICLVLIAAYIFGGSVLFTLWEDWDYLTGSYFCFITLSTIGFGDIVPGTDMKEWNSQEKLVLCAMYLAFGLSLLAMCFNLMQEEVKEKCKWFGQKVGLLKDAHET